MHELVISHGGKTRRSSHTSGQQAWRALVHYAIAQGWLVGTDGQPTPVSGRLSHLGQDVGGWHIYPDH